ncbi:hypothetical protein BJ508DRAFT_322373 [Ascobolus immersus RN42]|uniref:Uncharacterized protein n=1 Tax=Ascobolus immersus RN42 TaxID=1160509 RepID=A0A3N4IHZ1_ASCIM|nr:hypothetical protein BJ508DRAFT_322373 [Ascobolus immersus RN42]
MPEGMTYSDIARRLSLLEYSEKFELRIFPEYFVKEPFDYSKRFPSFRVVIPAKTIPMKANRSIRDRTKVFGFSSTSKRRLVSVFDNPVPPPSTERKSWKTLEGRDGLLDLCEGQFLTLRGTWIEAYGKELGIPLIISKPSMDSLDAASAPRTSTFIRAHFAQHGIAALMSRKEYDHILNVGMESEGKRIQLALVGPTQCVVFTDNNKLARYWFLDAVQEGQWWNEDNGPCPIRFPDLFEKHLRTRETYDHFTKGSHRGSIVADMTNGNKYFNGIGTSHAAEILHLACIHPETLSKDVFESTISFNGTLDRLLKAVREFFGHLETQRYKQFVPTRSNTLSAFENPASQSGFYNGFTKVYRKAVVRVPLTHYMYLKRWGWLDPRYGELKANWEDDLVTPGTIEYPGRLRTKELEVYKLKFVSQKAMINLHSRAKAKREGIEHPTLQPAYDPTPITWHTLHELSQVQDTAAADLADAFENDVQEESVSGKGIPARFYTYTAIKQQPYAGGSAIIVPNTNTLNYKGNIPELGVASNFQTKKEDALIRSGMKPAGRRASIHTGKPGRPSKRKRSDRDDLWR